MGIAVGRLVDVDRVGPSRVLEANENFYKIECFISPSRQEVLEVDRYHVSYLKLPPQTRVYVQSEGTWKFGRVVLAHERSDDGHSYDIQFSNKVESRHDEEKIYCRCWFPPDDPTATLATGGIETQFWHDRRQGLTETLLAQRSACRGLSGILSSRVEIIPHQVEVARRILEDPLQRYLLADEVGMGKTIEAGMVIRQFLLSEEPGQVLVVSPKELVQQWRFELEDKFIISEFPDRVSVVSTSEFQTLNCDASDVQLLVVDEAHALVSGSFSSKLTEFANASPRLMLLSATPSLGNPEILLNLLRLIDPDCYRDVTVAEFSERVAKREDIGLFLRGLRIDASPAILRQRLRRIPELLPSDQTAFEYAEDISTALSSGEKDLLRSKINELRSHVADVHRIHHRLIRTRRSDAADWVFIPRGPEGVTQDNSHIQVHEVEDSRYAELVDIFEQWRVELASSLESCGDYDTEILSSYLTLFESLGSGVDCFARTLKGQPEKLVSDEWRNAYHIALDNRNESEERAQQVAWILLQYISSLEDKSPGKSPKIAVFGSDSEDVKSCAIALSNQVGSRNIFCSSINPVPIVEFLRSDEFGNFFCALFCTREEEEGLNLHMFDAVVHLDLPFSPTRMEQRIGRLDRFGRKTYVPQLIILPDMCHDLNPWEAWFETLRDGFRIFNEPVADVQFALEGLVSDLGRKLLIEGANGLRGSVDMCREHLLNERERLDNQYALDKVFQDEDAAGGFFEGLEDLDADEMEVAEAVKMWAIEALQLTCIGNYKKVFRLNGRHALIPAMMRWAMLFRDALTESLTFKRRLACAYPGDYSRPKLLRIGSPLFSALESMYRWDDRGRAFATWRKVFDPQQDEWIAFKLCYIVECQLPEGLSEDEKRSLRSRGDWYFTPWAEVMFLDANLEVVDDPYLLECLSRPYDPKKKDYNLGSRQDALYKVISPVQFENICHKVRERSESWLRDSPAFQEKVAEGVVRGQMDINKRNRRLTMRKNACDANGEFPDAGLDRAMEINRSFLESLENPQIKLDAIGMIVLSGRSPEEFE